MFYIKNRFSVCIYDYDGAKSLVSFYKNFYRYDVRSNMFAQYIPNDEAHMKANLLDWLKTYHRHHICRVSVLPELDATRQHDRCTMLCENAGLPRETAVAEGETSPRKPVPSECSSTRRFEFALMTVIVGIADT